MNSDHTEPLTYEERATWGTCTVCGARHGEWCVGYSADRLGEWKCAPAEPHEARLEAAPKSPEEERIMR